MPYQDLRQFLDKLEKSGQLCRVKAELDIRYEIGAVCDRSFIEYGQDKNPALIFENPKGYSVPIAANILATRRRLAQAIECEAKDYDNEWIRRTSSLVEPVIVRSGPCKENIKVGEQVNLYDLPIPTWNEKDAGPFITYACHISKDPETGRRNVGMYRSQVHDKNTLGIFSAPVKHIAIQFSKAHAKGNSFPVALAIGLDPVIPIAATSPLPFGTDEIAVAGALRGSPIELVKCETVPLEVPATAEWVLEGEILPGEKRDEGPFGEAMGYYGEVQPREVIHVTAITHRNNPIYQAAHMRRSPNEQSVMSGVYAEIVRQCPLPGLADFHIPEGGTRLIGIAAIRKTYEPQAKTLAMGILGSTAGQRIKIMIVVDDDIDVHNMSDVLWAIATRCDIEQGLQVLNNLLGSSLDPSMPEIARVSGSNLVSKLVIDATKPLTRPFPDAIRPKDESVRKVNLEWENYGIHEVPS